MKRQGVARVAFAALIQSGVWGSNGWSSEKEGGARELRVSPAPTQTTHSAAKPAWPPTVLPRQSQGCPVGQPATPTRFDATFQATTQQLNCVTPKHTPDAASTQQRLTEYHRANVVYCTKSSFCLLSLATARRISRCRHGLGKSHHKQLEPWTAKLFAGVESWWAGNALESQLAAPRP